MCRFKETYFLQKNIILVFGGTEPPFWANLLFGYAQSGYKRTSFSGSTVRCDLSRPVRTFSKYAIREKTFKGFVPVVSFVDSFEERGISYSHASSHAATSKQRLTSSPPLPESSTHTLHTRHTRHTHTQHTHNTHNTHNTHTHSGGYPW